jgi:hypothetical protein
MTTGRRIFRPCFHAQPGSRCPYKDKTVYDTKKRRYIMGYRKRYAADIVWETDGLDPEELGLPDTMEIPDEIRDLDDVISYMEDQTGWLVDSFDIEPAGQDEDQDEDQDEEQDEEIGE